MSHEVKAVSWSELAQALRHRFAIFTGAQRCVSDADLSYMAEKLEAASDTDNKQITLHQFAKVTFLILIKLA